MQSATSPLPEMLTEADRAVLAMAATRLEALGLYAGPFVQGYLDRLASVMRSELGAADLPLIAA